MEEIKFKTEKEFFETIENSEDFSEYKEEKLSNFDSEKGFVEVTVYLERESDSKKFTAFYTRGGQGNEWAEDLTFYEVTQKTKKPKKITYTEDEVYNLFMNGIATKNVLEKKSKPFDAEIFWEQNKKK